jgi:hypothetical protein
MRKLFAAWGVKLRLSQIGQDNDQQHKQQTSNHGDMALAFDFDQPRDAKTKTALI